MEEMMKLFIWNEPLDECSYIFSAQISYSQLKTSHHMKDFCFIFLQNVDRVKFRQTFSVIHNMFIWAFNFITLDVLLIAYHTCSISQKIVWNYLGD